MAKNLFAKAVEDATFTVKTSRDGSWNYGDKGDQLKCELKFRLQAGARQL